MSSAKRKSLLHWPMASLALATLVVLFYLDVHLGTYFNPSVAYGAVLMVCWWARDRRVLIFLSVLSVILTFLAHFVEHGDSRALTHRLLATVTILATTLVFDHLIRAWNAAILHTDALEASNIELASHEEEIARQNEELQSQTEELERQSEELRVSNLELSRRERSLSVLLELSPTLSIDLPRSEVMQRICQTLDTLLDGDNSATAILELQDDQLHVVCHHGFGHDGIQSERLPVGRSFSTLVSSHGQTGYIEDLSLRPDLLVPQPKSGSPIVSVISTPLRIGNRIIGAIEGYSTHKRAWTMEQIALIESLASQTSTTLRSERLYEETALQKQKFEAIFRGAPVGVAMLEDDSTIIRLNPTGAALLGTPLESDLRDGSSTLVRKVASGEPLANEAHYLAEFVQAMKTGEEVVGKETDIALISGRRLSILYNVAQIKDQHGRRSASVAAFVDVTPMKDLQRELDMRRREAEEASVRKTRFLAAVSHDVRTPANAISLLAELIRRTAITPGRESEIAEMSRELHSSAMALVNLLGDVLDVTRFDAGRIELQETDFNLNELLAMECKHLSPLARDKGIDFVVETAPTTWIHADKVKLARVLGNLVGNAIKFTEKGEVRVSFTREADGRTMIAVTDTGLGIAAENVPYIFDEFFQLRNPERDRNKGNGLGLTICKRLADAMGAELSVNTRPGTGSTFAVHLPQNAVIHKSP